MNLLVTLVYYVFYELVLVFHWGAIVKLTCLLHVFIFAVVVF